MNRLDSRYNRLFKKTHVFVPRRHFELIVEFHKLRLETIEKQDGLQERTIAFGKLFEEAYRSSDVSLKDEVRDRWWKEEDARLNYFLPIHERTVKNCGNGLWFRNSTAKQMVELAGQAKSEIAKMNEETAKQQT